MSAVKKQDRVNELLGDRALEGLSEQEASELASLLEGTDDPSFDLAAAAADLATIGKLEPMPASLATKVAAQAAGSQPASYFRARPPAAAPRRDVVRFAGWMAAAACLALAVTVSLTRPSSAPIATVAPPAPPRIEPSSQPPSTPSPEELRTSVLASADAVHVDWSPTKDPAARGATGDVAWSSSEQRGYMRFHGLAANDATKSQYQLWIFDPSQDAKTPIDGGVFDIDPSSGDVLVPITPKLHVTKPTLFAVTVEKPGGVVVSKRERIVVVAAVKG